MIPSGYCKGVVNAIAMAKKARIDYPQEKIRILGMLVHNSYVSKELAALDIITLDDSLKSKSELIDEIEDGIVIFTAHGISNQIREKVIAKGLKYIDATCVDVLKTQEIILAHLRDGYDVIYFGKKNHPEAEAVLSLSEKIHLVGCEDELMRLQIENPKIFLTNQTTMSFLELHDLIEKAKERFPKIEVLSEICNATGARQKAIRDLKDCDLLYVVGDPRSNNTRKLADIAERQGIKKVRMIQTCEEIDHNDLTDVEHVYVTAGASTPPYLIEGVMERLRAQAR